jgi:hypothetical protein
MMKPAKFYDVAKANPASTSRGLKDHPHINAETKNKIKMANSMVTAEQFARACGRTYGNH